MNKRRRPPIDRPGLFAGAAIAAGMAASVSAAEVTPAPRLEMVVVTGTRLFESQARLPFSMTLIDQAEVETRNPASLPDLLAEQTGLHVSQPGGGGGVTSLFIRGGEPNFATVLIDGVKMNDPNNTRGGSFDISSFNIGDVERIEIVRGPQSAIYGSDSLSGVVNLITQAGAPKWGLDVSAEGGTHEYYNLAAAVAGPVTGKGGFTLRAATRDDGTSIDGSSFENTTVNAKLVLDEGTGWDVAIHGRYADSEGSAFPEDSGGPEFAVIRDRDRKSATDSAFGIDGGVVITPDWTLRGTAYLYDHDDTFTSPGIAPGVRDGVPPRKADSSLTRDYVSGYAVWQTTTGLAVTFGADYQGEDGKSNGYIEFGPGFQVPSSFRLDRDIVGVFGEVQVEPATGLTILGSVRNDNPDVGDSQTTTRVGAVYTFNSGTTRLHANWGQGFKLPSFFALGHPLVGNPDLKPETSESYDFGIEQLLLDGRVQVGATYFNNDYEDLIDFDPEIFLQVNRDSVTTSGVEFEARYDPAAELGLRAHVTYIDYEIPSGADPLRQRPDWSGGIDATWRPTASLETTLAWLYVGETYDTSIPTGGIDLDAYNRVDVNVRWQAAESLVVALAVDNLLNADYEDAVGFPAPGILPRLSVRYRFE
jgi:iron complex outermembrane receptor protein/vitamin B12 transporter